MATHWLNNFNALEDVRSELGGREGTVGRRGVPVEVGDDLEERAPAAAAVLDELRDSYAAALLPTPLVSH